jgi:hypothetical protein
MAEQWKSPRSGDRDRRMDEDDQVRGIADEGDDAFEEDQEDLDDEEEEEEEEGGTS